MYNFPKQLKYPAWMTYDIPGMQKILLDAYITRLVCFNYSLATPNLF